MPDFPIYQLEENDVNFKLAQYDKSTTSREFFQFKFRTEIDPEYQNYFKIYTDGSKNEDGKVSYCAFFPDIYSSNLSNRITDGASIFTAEAMAISKALSYIKISPRTDRRFVIFSDSKSVLESIANQETKNPLSVSIWM